MIYAMTSLWLLVIVLLAGGVHHLWRRMLRPRAVDAILLPATVIERLAVTIALLITGAAPAPAGPPPSGDAKDEDAPPTPRIPVVGPVILALVPMASLVVVLYVLVGRIGTPVLAQVPSDLLATQIPADMSGLWDQLRKLLTLAESTLQAMRGAETSAPQTAAFVYLMICLSVRLGPLPGNVRGHVGAVIAVGLIAALAGSMAAWLPDAILYFWPLLSLMVGWLLLLLLASLAVRGTILGYQALTRPA